MNIWVFQGRLGTLAIFLVKDTMWVKRYGHRCKVITEEHLDGVTNTRPNNGTQQTKIPPLGWAIIAPSESLSSVLNLHCRVVLVADRQEHQT